MTVMEDSGIDSDTKSNVFNEIKVHNDHKSSLIPNELSKSNDQDSKQTFHFDRNTENESPDSSTLTHQDDAAIQENIAAEHGAIQPTRLMNTAQLQKRLERQIQEAKKIRQQIKDDTNENQKRSLIPRNRLPVPNKQFSSSTLTKADEQPLVSWESDSSEDSFEFHPMGKSMEITHQLKKDGYNLDLTPDDEDLDLIPPKPINERCTCCFFNYSCSVM